LVGVHGERAQDLEEMRQSLRQKTEILARGPAMEARVARLRDAAAAQSDVFGSSSPEIALQETLRREGAALGVLLDTTEALSPQGTGALDMVRARITFATTIDRLQRFLRALEIHAPLLKIDVLDVRARPGADVLAVSLEVSALAATKGGSDG